MAKVGRPLNDWETTKRTVPVPALGDFQKWLAQWKLDNEDKAERKHQ